MTAQITVVGNLTRDPELKFSKSGVAFTKFSVASNKGKKQKNGEYENIPHYFDGTAFGDLAENMAESLGTGDKVVIVGELQYDSWEDADGGKRSKVSIIANSMGAELSRATAEVTRMESESNKKPATNKAGAKRGGSSRRNYEEDEEPF